MPVQPRGMTMSDNTCMSPDDTPQNDMLNSLLETRKSWKRSGTGEAIWSIPLETALLEGLQQYRPTACRDTLLLGRFPRRNQFISQYVWRKTGQRRTPKQVGSRLQQLRESCPDQKLWDLLHPSPKSIIDRSLATINEYLPAHQVFVIDILPKWVPELGPLEVPLQPWSENNSVTHVSHHPRRISCIDPTITLVSRAPILARSKFTVCTEDCTVHIETAALKSAPGPAVIIHRAALVPGYWDIIVESPDPTRYTIFHEVTLVDDCRIVFSAAYTFAYSPQYSEIGIPHGLCTQR
ncbi:hypothetical protein C8R44DRAFT_893783 [Mycena epipterygia]|nr:hypothetical protein C8R44DRAFT_893783 [Mycena epipterygia]